MRLILLAALITALPACTTPPEPMSEGQFQVTLRAQGLDDPYSGAAEPALFFSRELWRAAFRGDDGLTVQDVTFYRREPVWEDAWWTRITNGLDSTLTADGWTPIAHTQDKYVRGWMRGPQRLVIGRSDLRGDSTSYVTAALTGPFVR